MGKMLLSASILAFSAGSFSISDEISEVGFFIGTARAAFLGLSSAEFFEEHRPSQFDRKPA
jgi:hypothetical protein